MKATVFGYKMLGNYRAVDVALKVMRTSNDVFWTERCNSYVLVRELTKSEAPEGYVMDRAQWLHNGVPVHCLSINGMGEIRWSIKPGDVYDYTDLRAGVLTPSEHPTDREMMPVIEHFNLKVRR
jgi:hypothetical protein